MSSSFPIEGDTSKEKKATSAMCMSAWPSVIVTAAIAKMVLCISNVYVCLAISHSDCCHCKNSALMNHPFA